MVVQKYDPTLYDETEYQDGLYNLELNEGLTPKEIEDAKFLEQIGLIRGVVIITGPPRSGKDLFGTVLSWKLKRYFKGRHIFRDDRPRLLYGGYTPFNEDTLLNEVSKMESVSKGKETKSKEEVKQLQGQIERWRTKKGEVMLQNSIIYLTEFWRYMHNRRPMNPMGILMGGIVKIWGHLDTMVIGIAQQRRELDAISCLPYITHEVQVSWSTTRPDTADCIVRPVRFVTSRGVFEVSSKPIKLYVDGGAPREALGGKRYYDLYNSKSPIALRPRVHFSM